MGMVKDLLKNMFPNAQHRCVQDPDWAVAYGASLYCCHLQSQSMDKGVSKLKGMQKTLNLFNIKLMFLIF